MGFGTARGRVVPPVPLRHGEGNKGHQFPERDRGGRDHRDRLSFRFDTGRTGYLGVLPEARTCPKCCRQRAP